jgi:uncharacterized protein
VKYPEQYHRYLELFNAGEFWEAHEVLEEIWQRDHGDKFLQGLILLAASYVHVQRNNPNGVRKTSERALGFLVNYLPRRWDLDVDWLCSILRKNLGMLERWESGRRVEELVPYIRLRLEEGPRA